MGTYGRNRKSLVTIVIFLILLLLLGSHLVIANENNVEAQKETTVDIAISQKIEKYLPVDDQTVLLQQKVRIESNNIAVKEKEEVKISAPKLIDKLPDTAIVLYNGKKLQDNLYSYDVQAGQVYIQNMNGQSQMNNTAEYTIIYGYMNTNIEEEISINSRVEVNIKLIDNDVIFSNQNDYEDVINPIGNKVSISGRITPRINKGYMYTVNKGNISFAEQYNVEISNLQNVQELNISNHDLTFFINDENQITADEYVFFDTTIINKENMINILGEDGQIQVLNEKDEIIYVINNSTQTDENGNIRIEYGNNGLAKNMKLRISSPKEIGVLEFANIKHLNTNVNYDIEQIKNIKSLREKITVNDSEMVLNMNLEEPKTTIALETNKNQLDTMNNQNELEINITLKTNESTEKLFKNPYIEIVLPSQVENIVPTEDIKLLYDQELHITNYEIQNNIIRIYVEGQQTNYKEGSIENAILNLKLNVKLNNKATDSEEKIQVKCINDGEETLTEGTMNIITPKDVIMVNSIEELNVETVGESNTEQVIVLPSDTNRSYQVKSQVIVNKDNMKDVTIVGDLPTDSNVANQNGQILENNMGMTLTSDVITNIEGQAVYYTNNANASNDLQDPNNGWSMERPEDASKYLIMIPEMNRANTVDVEYTVQTDSQMEYNETAYQGYYVQYANEDRTVTNTAEANYLAFTTGQGPELENNLYALVGDNYLEQGEKVQKGQVIKYIVEVRNTGAESVDNATIYANIPEGTTYVEPIPSYQYKPGEYYQEIEKDRQEFTIENLGVGETAQKTYEVRVNSDAVVDSEFTNIATVEYDGVQKTTQELKNVVADAGLRVSIKTNLDDEGDVYEGDMIEYQAIIENISNVTQENASLKWNISGAFEIIEQTIVEISETGSTETSQKSNTDTISLGNIDVGQKVVVDLLVQAKEMINAIENINIYAQVLQGNNTYISNNLAEQVTSRFNVDVNLETDREGEYLTPGEEISYNLTITNNNASKVSVYVYDELPIELTVKEIYINGENQEVSESSNIVSLDVEVEEDNTTSLEIKANINQIEGKDEVVQINNVASVYVGGVEKRTNEVSHFIEYQVIEGTENVDISLETNNEGEYVHPGDEINYIITVNNYNTVARDAYIYDQIPSELTVQEVIVNGEAQELGENPNMVEILNQQLGTGENNQTVIEIRTIVAENINNTDTIRISNTATLAIEGEEKTTEEVNHIIDYKQENPDDESDVDIDLEANRIGEYLTAGDEINYQIILTNHNSVDKVVSVRDEIPLQLDITGVILNGQSLDLEIQNNVVEINNITLDTQNNQQAIIEIRTVVKDGTAEETIQISNTATLTVQDELEKQSNTIIHLIRYDGNDDPGGGNENPEGQYEIRGNVWLDGNQNGEMQSDEEKVSNVNVYLIDITTGEIAKSATGNNIQATTDQNGDYILLGITRGSYLVAFDYDTRLYKLTAYMQSGVGSASNSKVVARTMTINGNNKSYGVTDTINITDSSIGNINMGLVQTQIFDMKLDKYITQVAVSGGGNSVVYDYNKVSLAKVELRSNLLKNSTVVVEYTIEVTNVGEIAGYARSIVDYIPEGFTFNSELNKGWMQNGDMISNTSLTNEEIAPNEARSVTLILTKTMSDSQTGTYTNTAELAETYNSRGVTDINSTAGNRQQGENDMSSADLIIGVSTGEVVMYVGLTLSLITIIAVGIYFIKKKVLDVNSKERG